jgi:hypothetical protein
MAATLVLRTVKGSPLTNLEVDNNFSNLNTFGDVVSSNVGILSALTTTSTSNIVSAVNSLKSGNLSQFGTTTSLQLASIITDETGSGNLVLSTNPVLTTANLGTPSYAVLTNATGLPVASGISGLGSGVATFLAATPTSANLAVLLSDETGTGNIVFNNSPTLANPTISAYTENVITVGTVTTASTLSIANGTFQTVTLTASTACTFTMPTAVAGKSFILLLKQAASTGNGTATFTGVKWGLAGAPTITATAGKMDLLTFVSDGTNWYGSASQGYTP